jgi:hypothetical protein
LVGLPLEPEQKLVFPVPGERKVGMAIDEARQGDAVTAVDPGCGRFDLDLFPEILSFPDEDDLPPAGRDPAVLDDAQVLEGPPPLGKGTAASDKLAAVGDDAVS